MALKPSRRIPRAFQRSTSPLSRRIARRLVANGAKRARKSAFPRILRQVRRVLRVFQGSFPNLTLWVVCVIVALCIGSVLFFLFYPTFKIHSIRVSREDRRIDVEDIQSLLAPTFGRHILFISPLLVARDIQSAFPEISSAEVRRIFPNELYVRIHMDEIAGRILVGEPDDTEQNLSNIEHLSPDAASGTGNSLYRYVSTQGIYLEYPFFPEQSSVQEPLPLLLVDWAVKPAHRQRVLDPDILKSMQQVRAILEQSFGNSVAAMTVYLRAREFHVITIHPGRSPGSERLVLWFDQASPVLEQINRYREFLRAVPLDKAVEYVDLRLHDRVVYR